MKNGNILVSISLIVLALAFIFDHYNVVNDTVFGIMLGVAIGLGVLNLIIPCVKKKK